MPGGLTLVTSPDAFIPTPPVGKITLYYSTNLPGPAYKNSAGAVLPLGSGSSSSSNANPMQVISSNEVSEESMIWSPPGSEDAGVLTRGALLDARLSSNVALKNAANAFTGANSFATNPLDLLVGQMKFPASHNPSSNANTLDDYEEGSWTPVDASGGVTLGYVDGSYIKIGRLVCCTARADYPVNANSLGAKLGGLPFVSDSSSNSWAGFFSYNNYGAYATMPVLSSSATFAFYTPAGVQILNSAFSGVILTFTIVYGAAA